MVALYLLHSTSPCCSTCENNNSFPALYEDRPTVIAIHALKVEKYAVARAAAAIGLYPSEARETAASLRLDPCPAE